MITWLVHSCQRLVDVKSIIPISLKEPFPFRRRLDLSLFAVIFEFTQTLPLSTVDAKCAIRWWATLPTHQFSVEVWSFGLHVLLTWTQWGCIKVNIYTMQSKLATTWTNPGCCERHWKQTCTTDSGEALYSILQWCVRVSWREGTSSLVVKKEAEMCASPHYAIRHVC
jgi:hypothetical protein